jgi:hypothetical protein
MGQQAAVEGWAFPQLPVERSARRQAVEMAVEKDLFPQPVLKVAAVPQQPVTVVAATLLVEEGPAERGFSA